MPDTAFTNESAVDPEIVRLPAEVSLALPLLATWALPTDMPPPVLVISRPPAPADMEPMMFRFDTPVLIFT
jgi:hypothetical protein